MSSAASSGAAILNPVSSAAHRFRKRSSSSLKECLSDSGAGYSHCREDLVHRWHGCSPEHRTRRTLHALHALTTRFRNDGSTLCLLGLTGSRCGWGEELWEDGVKVDCISGRTVQVCRSIPGTAMGCVERDVGEGR